MIKDKYPFCSIIVLNYFGDKLIGAVVSSLLKLDYPKVCFEIIIIDNNSQDRSKKIIGDLAKKHKIIKAFYLQKNIGFSRGNNVGIRNAKGKYVALLNNDCVVEKNWLKELVKTAESDDKIFAVNSKIKLYPSHVTIALQSGTPLLIEESKLIKSNLCKIAQKGELYMTYRNKGINYYLEVPYDPIKDREINIVLGLGNIYTKTRALSLLGIPEEDYRVVRRRDEEVDHIYAINISITENVRKNSYDLIQNAGIIVFNDGAGRDIGAIVKYQDQSYEADLGQYDTVREVYAACAAASLYNKSVFEKLGYLDETYFMYYEDVDICERARFLGYKIFYQPKAEARHMHALSSKEGSPFFIYHAEKGRFLHILHNFPLRIFISEYIKFFSKVVESTAWILVSGKLYKLLKSLLKNESIKDKQASKSYKITQYFQYLKVTMFFFVKFPILVFNRYRKNKDLPKNALEDNYRSITEGDWFFK